MYSDIQTQKNLGFSKRSASSHLGMNYRTVAKYWDMTPDECEVTILNRERRRCLELYDGVVLDWLRTYPDISAAIVHDWLKEHYQVTVHDRTVRRYVGKLRKAHDIPKVHTKERPYQAVEELPMGQQMQVDIGIATVADASTFSARKLYCIGCVLSHSRYKWGKWFATPPTTSQFTATLEECFEHLGGMPKELVFDQDRLVVVAENYGDILYTHAFESFKQRMKFNVYLCRGADPESKGKVEAVVKYFKRNFASHRKLMGIDLWNESFQDWLDRTGNNTIHGTTKKIPAEVFRKEKAFLKPVPDTRKIYTSIVSRQVHKDNTIFYKGSRYSLPLGTYLPGREVTLTETDGRLQIYDNTEAFLLAEHQLATERGTLVRIYNHGRDYSEPLDKLQETLLKALGSGHHAQILLTQIRALKRRYARDQYSLIEKSIQSISSTEAIGQALVYCVENSLYSAVDFRDALDFFAAVKPTATATIPKENSNIISFVKLAPQKRSLQEYAALTKRGEE